MNDKYDPSGFEPVEFEDVTTVHVSDKAMLCNIDDKKVWIPMSQIHEDSEVFDKDNTEGKLVIPRWLATEKGIV